MSAALIYDADSARPCLACGHAVPHDLNDYDESHSRCEERIEREGFDFRVRCECSEEDRLLADYRAEVLRLREWLEGIRDAAKRQASSRFRMAAELALAGESENYQYRAK